MLAKLGISVDRKYITGMMKKLDTNGTGVIEFEEFANLIINDPYKWANWPHFFKFIKFIKNISLLFHFAPLTLDGPVPPLGMVDNDAFLSAAYF